MSRQNTWANSDGLTVGFGRHTDDADVPAVTGGSGDVKFMRVEINASDLVDTFAATSHSGQSAIMRRGSVILSATLQATVAWTGTGTLDIGTWGVNLATEVVDDADGIDAAIDIDSALAAVGDIVDCDGALVAGAVSVGETSDSDVIIAPSYNGTVTTGSAVLTIRYIEPQYNATLAV